MRHKAQRQWISEFRYKKDPISRVLCCEYRKGGQCTLGRIRGKRPTVAQYRILQKHGVENNRDWLLQTMHYLGDDGDTSPSRNRNVTTRYVFVHKDTGEEMVIDESRA